MRRTIVEWVLELYDKSITGQVILDDRPARERPDPLHALATTSPEEPKKRALTRKSLHLVRSFDKTASPSFKVGERIPKSGIYRVFYAGHRMSHEVVLLRGEAFPRCALCGTDVHFELLEAAPQLDSDQSFRDLRKGKLFEIPHPDEAKSA